MAEKRFYWLKLKENYFDSPKIKKLRKIAGGDTYTIIYLKMQLLSICNGGIINFEGIELSFEEELALKLDEQLEDVQLTLAYLKQQKLVEESDESFLLIEACNNIGSEGQSAERKRRFDARKQERALLGNDSVTEEKRNSISISNISNLNSNNIDNNIHLQDNKEKESIKEKDIKHKYGEYGWIKLTDNQYEKLCKDFSKEYIDLVIEKIDEYIQSNGNKNKYKDWNLIIRKSIRDKWSCLKDIKSTPTEKPTTEYEDIDICYISKYGSTVFDTYPRKKGQKEWTEEEKSKIMQEKEARKWVCLDEE